LDSGSTDCLISTGEPVAVFLKGSVYGKPSSKEQPMKTLNMNRREFLAKSAAATMGASLAAGFLAGCASKPTAPRTVTLDISQTANAALANVNGGVKIAVDGESHPVIVTRTSNTDVAAFSSKCTHMGCDVGLPDASGVISCPCHGSTFSIDGHVSGGPAQSNLTAFAATLSGTIITITI
jgi:cytochrome b6-f complex iron-sulfur subunit